METVAAVTPRAHITSTGADLLGQSALPLLGTVPSCISPWLFVVTGSVAWMSYGQVTNARFEQATIACSKRWPFESGALGGVVIDGDRVARELDDAGLEGVLKEACRTSSGPGNVLVICGDKFRLRRLREWREYGRPSAHRWRRAAAAAGLEVQRGGFARSENQRVVELITGGGQQFSQARRQADRLVLRIGGLSSDGHALEAIVADAVRALGVALEIERITVRKIGKTAVFLSDAGGGRYVLRIARSPIARSRAARNFEALSRLQASSLPPSIKSCIPSPSFSGRLAGYEYSIETRLEGRSRRSPRGPHRVWNVEAARFISALHTHTQRRAPMDEATLDRLVQAPLVRLIRACESAIAEVVLRRIIDVCRTALEHQVIPLVQTHGDFTEEDCLCDERGTLTGVVDWEVSVANGLPLLDLLQLMPVEGESSAWSRWQRFDAWMELWRNPGLIIDDPVIGRYVQQLALPIGIVRALVLLQWATHVADRVEARRDDERWMRIRLWQPLERIGRLLSD